MGCAQHVHLESRIPDVLVVNTGVPPGYVLSPVLFYIDCRNNLILAKLVKYADDMVLVGCLIDEFTVLD